MGEDDDIKNKVIDFFKYAKSAKKDTEMIKITNSRGVIIGDNSNITNLVSPKIIKKTVIKRERDDEYITTEQSVIIRDLVQEIVNLEKILKRRPRGYQAVYGSFFNKFHILKRDLIPKDKFDMVVKYLRGELGRLRGMPSAKYKLPDWRKKKYAYIHIQIKKYNLESKLRTYLDSYYGVSSLTNLDIHDLEKVAKLVAQWVARSN